MNTYLITAQCSSSIDGQEWIVNKTFQYEKLDIIAVADIIMSIKKELKVNNVVILNIYKLD